MSFKLWLEANDIKIGHLTNNGDSTDITVVYGTSVYRYNTPYGPIAAKIYEQGRFAPGKAANKLKEMVSKKQATVVKIR